MKKAVKKLSKAKLWAIISSVIVSLFALAILIINIFIPVKYLASYFVAGNRENVDNMRVSFIDVGFGDCIIIELPDGKNMLIDAGNGRYSNNLKVLKELNRREIDNIDYLVCSSVNGEHCGGLAEVLKFKDVKTVFMPYCKNKYITDEFRALVEQTEIRGIEVLYSEYKSGIAGDGYFFTFLSPSVKELDGGEYSDLNANPSKSTRNNSSAVIWLEYADTAFLFTSDVETDVLNSIVTSSQIAAQDYPVKLEKCKIVQVANHGEDISACAMFYDYISPEAAIISVGENGKSCPSVSVMSDIINCVDKNIYRTDELGNIDIVVTSSGYTIK